MQLPTRPLNIQELYFKNYISNAGNQILKIQKGSLLSSKTNLGKALTSEKLEPVSIHPIFFKVKTSERIKAYVIKNWPFLLIAFAGLTIVGVGVYLKNQSNNS